jgi:hypothetical protein
VRKRALAEIVTERRKHNGLDMTRFDLKLWLLRLNVRHKLERQMAAAKGMLKAGVSGRGIDQMSDSDLVDMTETLEFDGIDDLPTVRRDGEETEERILGGMGFDWRGHCELFEGMIGMADQMAGSNSVVRCWEGRVISQDGRERYDSTGGKER